MVFVLKIFNFFIVIQICKQDIRKKLSQDGKEWRVYLGGVRGVVGEYNIIYQEFKELMKV